MRRCPNCGHVDWEGAPAAKEAWNVLVKRGKLTSRELAQELNLEINTAGQRLASLEAAGLAVDAGFRSVEGGGREKVFVPVLGGMLDTVQ